MGEQQERTEQQNKTESSLLCLLFKTIYHMNSYDVFFCAGCHESTSQVDKSFLVGAAYPQENSQSKKVTKTEKM